VLETALSFTCLPRDSSTLRVVGGARDTARLTSRISKSMTFSCPRFAQFSPLNTGASLLYKFSLPWASLSRSQIAERQRNPTNIFLHVTQSQLLSTSRLSKRIQLSSLGSASSIKCIRFDMLLRPVHRPSSYVDDVQHRVDALPVRNHALHS
jgi:hypothetical protein